MEARSFCDLVDYFLHISYNDHESSGPSHEELWRHMALCPLIHLNSYLVSILYCLFAGSVMNPSKNNLS